MNNINDEAVLKAIGQITDKTDFDDPKHLKFILKTISSSPGFLESQYGRRFYDKIKSRLENLSSQQRTDSSSETIMVGELIKQSDEKTESLFRDIDESLFQVASQRTSRTTQKLVWVILGLSLVNTIALFFVALFLWKLNMG